jgi:hypothetical protein
MELTVQVTLGGYSRSQVHGNINNYELRILSFELREKRCFSLVIRQVKPAIFLLTPMAGCHTLKGTRQSSMKMVALILRMGKLRFPSEAEASSTVVGKLFSYFVLIRPVICSGSFSFRFP